LYRLSQGEWPVLAIRDDRGECPVLTFLGGVEMRVLAARDAYGISQQKEIVDYEET
jgi:hypothetical protein